MNEDNEYLQDVNVRKAIQMAINREKILEDLYHGEGIIENGIIATAAFANISGIKILLLIFLR